MSVERVMHLAYRTFITDPANWPDPVKGYVKSRKLSETTHLAVGFADESWDTLSNVLKAENLQEIGQQLGLLGRAESGRFWDMYRHRVIFPIRDAQGVLVGFGGRAIGDEKPKYINSAQSEVFDKSKVLFGLYESLQMGSPGPLNIVEGYTDVLSCIKSGEPAVAPMGTALTEHHLKLIGKHFDAIRMVFDGDTAGKEAASRSAMLYIAEPSGIESAEVTLLPEGADPDSLYQAGGPKGLVDGVQESVSMADFLFDIEFTQKDISTLGLKARAINSLTNIAKECAVPAVKAELDNAVQKIVDPQENAQPRLEHQSTTLSSPTIL